MIWAPTPATITVFASGEIIHREDVNLGKGTKATITISNQGTDGYVIADGVQALRTAIKGTRPNGSN